MEDYDVDRCRSCDAPVIWARTENDHWMPVDAEPAAKGRLQLRKERGGPRIEMAFGDDLWFRRPHLATCPAGRRKDW